MADVNLNTEIQNSARDYHSNYSNIFLTHIMPLGFFYTPCKYQKTRGLLVFLGGIETD